MVDGVRRAAPRGLIRLLAGSLAGALAASLAACGAPAASVSPSSAPTQTAAPTATPLVLVETPVVGVVTNSVTFTDVTYTLTGAVISNREPRTFTAGGEPELGTTLHAFLSLRGENAVDRRSETRATDFTLLLADGAELAVTELFGTGDEFIAPGSHAAADGYLAFEVAEEVDLAGAQLRIGQAPDRPAFLNLTADQPAPDYPIELEVSGEAPGIGVTNASQLRYTAVGGALHVDNPLDDQNNDTGRRANVDELFLVLEIRIFMESGSVEGTFKDQFRLIVDGVPREPWNFPDGGSIGPGAAVDTQVGWLIPADAATLELQVGDPEADPGLIDVDLPDDLP